MKKDEIFFAENGLTTTSANYIANLAKEQYRLEEQNLQDIKFFATKLELIGSEKPKIIEKSKTSDFLHSIKDELIEIAKLKSLIAWLREAIKAKDRLIKEARDMSDTEICEILGIELPKSPELGYIPTEDDVISSFDIKKRNRIYYLQTLCSQLGEFVHPGGSLSSAREALQEVQAKPIVVSESGRDTLIYTRTVVVPLDEVDQVYFDIQNTQRTYQAELNSLKHEIEVAIQSAIRESDARYSEQMSSFRIQMSEIRAKITEYRNQKVAAMQSLKIIIPDSLKAVYEKISKLGKQ